MPYQIQNLTICGDRANIRRQDPLHAHEVDICDNLRYTSLCYFVTGSTAAHRKNRKTVLSVVSVEVVLCCGNNHHHYKIEQRAAASIHRQVMHHADPKSRV